MALWDLLNAMCFATPVIFGVLGAKDAKVGFVGYTLAIGIGLVLGAGCTWTMWTVGERVGSTLQSYPQQQRERYFRDLYLAAVLWLLVVAFLANSATSLAMHFVASRMT
jgi:hypothetical protein